MSSFPTFPGRNAGFISNHEATAKLTVGFSRNPSKFPNVRYTKIVPVNKTAGYYLKVDPKKGARIRDVNEFRWAPGSPRPQGAPVGMNWVFVQTERFNVPFQLPLDAVTQADVDLVSMNAATVAQQAMTLRSKRIKSVMTTTANWNGNTDTATNLAGGVWAGSSEANGYILESLNAAKNAIRLSSAGVVEAKDLMLVVDVTGARIIAESPEYKSYLKQNPFSLAALRQDDREMFENYGLAPYVFGLKTVVDDTVIISSNEGATRVNENMFSGISTINAVAAVVARPEGIEGSPFASNFSTVSVLSKEEMTVEQREDGYNRLLDGGVTDDNKIELTAWESGYLITNIDS